LNDPAPPVEESAISKRCFRLQLTSAQRNAIQRKYSSCGGQLRSRQSEAPSSHSAPPLAWLGRRRAKRGFDYSVAGGAVFFRQRLDCTYTEVPPRTGSSATIFLSPVGPSPFPLCPFPRFPRHGRSHAVLTLFDLESQKRRQLASLASRAVGSENSTWTAIIDRQSPYCPGRVFLARCHPQCPVAARFITHRV